MQALYLQVFQSNCIYVRCKNIQTIYDHLRYRFGVT